MANLLIVCLAVHRLALFIRTPDASGPFGVLDWFRKVIGISYDENSQLTGSNPIAEGLTCSVCGPIWIAFVIAPFYFWWPSIVAIALLPLAIGEVSDAIDIISEH